MPLANLYADSELDGVFRAVAAHWMTKIRHSQSHKKRVFSEYADECQQFYNGPRSWDELMMSVAGMGEGNDFPVPDFKVSVNKAFEFVTIFGPALYYENPVRTVKPRMPVQIPPGFFPDPGTWQAMMMQEDARVRTDGLRGVLLESYLNWTPNEFGLSQEVRETIDEALIKGRGCMYTELYQPPGCNYKVVRSVYDSVDDLFVDPDATRLNRATWIARRRVLPVWQVERDYGLRKGSLRGNLESQATQSLAFTPIDSIDRDDFSYNRKRGLTNDLIVIYQVWSKMGIGGRLSGISPEYRAALEMFGDYCYLVISDGVPFLLNLPPDAYNDPSFSRDPSRVFGAVSWPTPFWVDDEWPVSTLDFHTIHNCPWPMPHLRAGMGELKFLNWVTSFLMGRIRTSCRDFIAIKKSLGEEIKTTILEGRDLTLMELEAEHGAVTELVQFLQHPEVNGDVWKMIDAVEHNFDKRVGLTELMYGEGGATQIRSAAEVSLRNQNMNIRPQDMSKQVEAWQSRVAAKEAFAARYHLRGEDVLPLLGQMGAYAWNQFVATTDTQTACRQLEYRIESGSTQRPNKEFEAKTMTDMFQNVGPVIQQYAAATGDVTPLNNLIADMARSRSLDPGRYQLRAAIPQQTQPAPGQDAAEQPERQSQF